MDRARSRHLLRNGGPFRTAHRRAARCALLALAALLAIAAARADAARIANLAHLKSVDRVAVEVNLEDSPALSTLPATEWKGKLEEAAGEASVVTSWGIGAMILAGPAHLDTCIVAAVQETVTDFARLVTRGVEPRSRSGSCTILRIDRR